MLVAWKSAVLSRGLSSACVPCKPISYLQMDHRLLVHFMLRKILDHYSPNPHLTISRCWYVSCHGPLWPALARSMAIIKSREGPGGSIHRSAGRHRRRPRFYPVVFPATAPCRASVLLLFLPGPGCTNFCSFHWLQTPYASK